MLQFTNLAGKRNEKEYNDPFIIASAADGDFRIMPKVAEVLEIVDGSSVAVVENDGVVYLAKGKDGISVLDEDGNKTFDKRGREQFEKGSSFGVIARSKNGSPVLSLTANAAWHTLGGSTEVKKAFTLGEGVEGEVPTGNKEYPSHKGTFYPLEFNSEIAKSTRGPKSKDEEGDTDTAALNQEEEVEVDL